MRKVTIVDWQAVRNACMKEVDFWKHLEGLPTSDTMSELERRILKLSYTKLQGYILQVHFLLRDLIDKTRTEALTFDEEVVVQNAIVAMLRGKGNWDSLTPAPADLRSVAFPQHILSATLLVCSQC